MRYRTIILLLVLALCLVGVLSACGGGSGGGYYPETIPPGATGRGRRRPLFAVCCAFSRPAGPPDGLPFEAWTRRLARRSL
jgi:hypothetical protein